MQRNKLNWHAVGDLKPTRPRRLAGPAEPNAIPMGRASFPFLFLWLLLGACSDQGESPVRLISIGISKINPSLAKGTTLQLGAMGTYSDQSLKDLTSQVGWVSSDNSVATVMNGGLVTSVALGTSDIVATAYGVSGKTTVTVTAATLEAIDITPAHPVIAKGTTQPLVATGTFSDMSTQDLSGQVAWSSSDTAIAAVDDRGLATGLTPGTSTLSATLSGKTGKATLSVTAATLVSIAITPTNPTIPKGVSQQLTATGTYTDGSTQDLTALVTWNSADMNIATIGNDPILRGRANWAGLGSTLISAALADKIGSTTLTATPATLVSLSVMPTNPSIPKGISQPFTATGLYTDNTTQDLTALVTWFASDTSLVAISNGAGSQGLATGIGTGATTISAALGGTTGNTILTVTPATLVSLSVMPKKPSIAKGTVQQLTAAGTYTDGSIKDITKSVTWASSDTSAATISNAPGTQGLATAVAVGATTILAIIGDKTDGTGLTVTAATLASITVTPINPSIAIGTSRQFIATGTYTDSATQDITPLVTWAASDDTVATISNAASSRGLATGVGLGVTMISATLDGKAGSTSLAGTTLVAIAVTPKSPSVAKGATQQFKATGTNANGSTQDLTTMVSWGSSDPTIATISNAAGTQGLATALKIGSTTISATLGGKTDSSTLTVTWPGFQFGGTFATGDAPQSVAVGDFNGDSKPDLVAGNLGGHSVSVFMNTGTGSFESQSQYDSAASCYSVAVGDFDGDGKLDIVTATGLNSVSVLYNGIGGLDYVRKFSVGDGSDSAAAGDFNGDGKLDIVSANTVGKNISVLLGNGVGDFAAAANYSTGEAPVSVAVADFNGDGKLDLTFVKPVGDYASVMLGTGTGSFGAPANYPVGSDPASIAVGDFNGDGKLDLAIANGYSSDVSVLLGTGTGSFGTATTYSIGGLYPNSIAVADFNGDSKPDLVTVNGGNDSVSVLLNTGTGSFGTSVDFRFSFSYPSAVAVADFDGNMTMDLAIASSSTDRVTLLLNKL